MPRDQGESVTQGIQSSQARYGAVEAGLNVDFSVTTAAVELSDQLRLRPADAIMSLGRMARLLPASLRYLDPDVLRHPDHLRFRAQRPKLSTARNSQVTRWLWTDTKSQLWSPSACC